MQALNFYIESLNIMNTEYFRDNKPILHRELRAYNKIGLI
jgi:hypothetical protein